MIITRAPFRVSFLGGGTDFPEWYKNNRGAVISTTIDKYCYVMARWLPPFFTHRHRIVWSQIELPNDIHDIKNNIVRETLGFLKVNDGIEIHHASDLPAQSGLGASSSFTVALLQAIYKLKGAERVVNKMQLTQEAIYIERVLCKQAGGVQDQISTSFGGLNRIDFGEEFRVKPLPCDSLEQHLMLFFTGFQRDAARIEKGKIKHIHSNESYYRDLYSLVNDGEYKLKKNDILGFGKLLHENWQIKKEIGGDVTTDYIDFLYDRAIKEGAIGGKILGAGGGGFLLLFVEPDKQEHIRKITKILEVPFSFESSGSKIIYNG